VFANYVDSSRRARDELGGVAVGGLKLGQQIVPSGGLDRQRIFCVYILQGLCNGDKASHGILVGEPAEQGGTLVLGVRQRFDEGSASRRGTRSFPKDRHLYEGEIERDG